MSLHPLRRLIIPSILLFAAMSLRNRVNEVDVVYQPLLDWLPYVLLGVCLSLAAYYNRSRVFTVTFALIAVYYLIQTELQVSLSEPRALLIYSMISTALPLTLACLLFLPERGLRNRYGLLLTAIVFITIAFRCLDTELFARINLYRGVKWVDSDKTICRICVAFADQSAIPCCGDRRFVMSVLSR